MRIFRTLLGAAAFLALLPGTHLHGQRMTFAGLRWGLPADSVRPRLEALGWRATGASEHGDLIFRLDSVRAQTVMAGGKLVQVTVVHPTPMADRESRLRFLVDSLAAVYGPPSRTNENGSAWEGNLSSLAATSTMMDGQAAAVALFYLGPGADRERDRRAGRADPFTALPEGWLELARNSDRRMAADTTSIAAVGAGTYRARVRVDMLEPLTEDGQPFDAITYEREHDCTRRRILSRNVVIHYQGRRVRELGNSGWTAVRPDTSQDTELYLVCALAAEYLGIRPPPTAP